MKLPPSMKMHASSMKREDRPKKPRPIGTKESRAIGTKEPRVIGTKESPRFEHNPELQGSKCMELRQRGIYLGMTASALSLFHKGEGSGITTNALGTYATIFPVIELSIEAQHPPHEEMLRAILGNGSRHRAQNLSTGLKASRVDPTCTIVWHIDVTDEKQLTEPTPEFLFFANHIATHAREKSQFIVSLDPTLSFSEVTLSGYQTCREIFSEIPLMLETAHPSWKRPAILTRLKREKIVHTATDGPPLFGIVKDIDYALPIRSYVRLLGRNPRTWFEPPPAKYEYTYSKAELAEIAKRISGLRNDSDEVFAVFVNHPVEVAMANALGLAALLTA